MKKFVITVFALFYLGISSGATVHFHYCMGQLMELGLSQGKADKCGNCGMTRTEARDCCKDEHQQFKVEKSQKASQNVYQFNLPSLDLPFTVFHELNAANLSSLQIVHPFGHAPPLAQNIPVFARNCNFRI